MTRGLWHQLNVEHEKVKINENAFTEDNFHPYLDPPLGSGAQLFDLVLLHGRASVVAGRLPVQLAGGGGDVRARQGAHGAGRGAQHHQLEGLLVGAVLVLDVDAVLARVLKNPT